MAEAVKNGTLTGKDGKGRFAPGNHFGHGRPPAIFSPTELLRAKVSQRPSVIERLLDLCESDDEQVAVRAIQVVLKQIDPQFPTTVLQANANATSVVIVRGSDTGV